MSVTLASQVARNLRRIRQRYTAQRELLVNLLAAAEHPLTFPDILAAASGLSKSSIYRNLTVLEQAGVIRRIVTTDDFGHYELSEAFTEHHHHLVCASCGRVEDFAVSPAFEQTIEDVAMQAGQHTGFRSNAHRFDLIGTCARCGAE